MVEYRRGIEGRTWQKLWHFSERCPDYPTRAFAIAEYQPFHEDVCPQCKSLAVDERRTN